MNQQQIQPKIVYTKCSDFPAVYENYYHPSQKKEDGSMIVLKAPVLITKQEWERRKRDAETGYKNYMKIIEEVFKIMDKKESKKRK